MLARLQYLRREQGFTLIELLVVVVIIGILIAIAIPLYLNYENGAKSKSSASDVRGAISTIEQCFSDNGSLPTGIGTTAPYSVTGCTGGVINASSNSTIKYYSSSGSYMLVGYQGTGSTWYCYNSSVGGAVKTKTTALPTAWATC